MEQNFLKTNFSIDQACCSSSQSKRMYRKNEFGHEIFTSEKMSVMTFQDYFKELQRRPSLEQGNTNSIKFDLEKWNHAQKILCIRPDNMGDVLMCTPAIKAIKKADINRHITLLSSSAGGQMAALIPEIDKVIAMDLPWIKINEPVLSENLLELVQQIKNERFDAAIIFTTYTQSALPAAFLALLAGIPLRLGYCHENPYHLLTNWVPDPEPTRFIRHEVERQLALIAAIGCKTLDLNFSLNLSDQDVIHAKEILIGQKVNMLRPWVIIHPGATALSRRYPPELYAKVVKKLCQSHGFQIVITGSRNDDVIADEIKMRSQSPIISLVGKTNLAVFASLIYLSPILISNNTVSIHIASATQTPVIVLYALTNIQHTPWQVPNKTLFHDAPCKLCYKSVCPMKHHACLRKIRPNIVVEETMQLLQQTKNIKSIHKERIVLCSP